MTRRSSDPGSRVAATPPPSKVKDKSIHSRRPLEKSTLSERGLEKVRLHPAHRRTATERGVRRCHVPPARLAATPEELGRIGSLQHP